MWKRLSASAIKYGFIPFAHNLIRLYLRTIRKTILGEEQIMRAIADGQKVIIAILHQRMFGVIAYAQRFSHFSPAAIISQSRDGDMIAKIVSRLNFHPVRGSSSKGGKEALASITQYLTNHPVAVHAVDGPRGPKGIVKTGIIRIAQQSGAFIYPVFISTDRTWILKSWDRFLIPKPFSRIMIRWGKAIHVPGCLSEGEFESLRQLIEKDILENHSRDDLAMGWNHPL